MFETAMSAVYKGLGSLRALIGGLAPKRMGTGGDSTRLIRVGWVFYIRSGG